jgi:DnaK suppressor protein
MDAEARAKLENKIIAQIEVQKGLIESFTVTSKPVAPDNAIGRLTRMEAISSQNISEASLNSARFKLVELEKALSKVGFPDFGICARCANPIPEGRILLMPENVLCVSCAEKK